MRKFSKKNGSIKVGHRNFPGGSVVKNPPHNARDAGLILGWGTRISHAVEKLSPQATTKDASVVRKT